MGDFMDAVRVILAIIIGAGIGYFWHLNPPFGWNDLLTVVVVTLVSIILLFVLLKSIGKGN